MRETGTVDSWAARWLAEASSSLRGSYAGRAYTVRSIRTGDPSKNGRAGGYALQVPHHYKPDDGIPAEADDFSDNGVATQFTTQVSGAAAPIVETASRLSLGAGSGAGTASPTAQSMTVTTDKADYAPGSTATFIVAGVNSGSSVAFQIADLASDPGINGIADVYAPFSVTDGGFGDSDGLANGVVVAKWQVPVDGSATGATLQLTATSGSQTATTTFSDSSDTPGDYNSVFGKALDISVPSEAPSSVTFQVTGLPTNGTVVLSDGTTPVSVDESLTPAQAAGLRVIPNGVAQNSQFDVDEVIPGQPVTHRSINIDQNGNAQGENDNTNGNQNTNGNANTVTTGPTAALPITATTTATPLATATPSNPNPIVLENEKPGTPQSVWQIAPGQDSTKIQGFTTNISTPVGGTVQFKINNQTGNGIYQIDIYRLGYYGGNGATLVTTLNHSGSAVVQPNPIVDSTTGEVDAGNWSVTDSWAVPASATSGVYVANVIDGSQVFQIPFIIRNHSSTSDIVFQTSDETWQAYNGFGGANLYGGNGPANPPPPAFGQGAAFAVSYNRPIVTRDSIGTYAGPQDSLFGAEYAAIYWLEQNGYDVSYISGIDTATNGSLLLNHKVFMDAGHDEYWTDSQVANVQAAANAGVNLAFLSGNEIFWQTRLSPSIDSSATANRTLVTYKDTHFNQEIDPSGKDTGTFEDPRLGPPPMPSNEVTGTLFPGRSRPRINSRHPDPLWRYAAALLAQHQRRHYCARSDGVSGTRPARL